MEIKTLKNIIEALLMSSSEALSVEQLLLAFKEDCPPKRLIHQCIQELNNDYQERSIEIKELATGYRIQTRAEYALWINHLNQDKPGRYSKALLEVLAIIAYRQPITRGEIEDIRGVSSSSAHFKTLLEREWIKIVGHKDVLGKPALYATTPQFLAYFNLKKLSDLPPLPEAAGQAEVE